MKQFGAGLRLSLDSKPLTRKRLNLKPGHTPLFFVILY